VRLPSSPCPSLPDEELTEEEILSPADRQVPIRIGYKNIADKIGGDRYGSFSPTSGDLPSEALTQALSYAPRPPALRRPASSISSNDPSFEYPTLKEHTRGGCCVRRFRQEPRRNGPKAATKTRGAKPLGGILGGCNDFLRRSIRIYVQLFSVSGLFWTGPRPRTFARPTHARARTPTFHFFSKPSSLFFCFALFDWTGVVNRPINATSCIGTLILRPVFPNA